MRRVWKAVGAIVLVATPLAAQGAIETGCVDRAERPIRGEVDNTIRYAGVATVLPDGTPVIYVNRKTLSKATPMARRFVLLHECAHHRLRHVYKDPARALEIEADCWAIQYLVEHRIVKPREVEGLQQELGATRGIGSLTGCLAVKVDPTLWRRSLDLLALAGTDNFASIRGAPIRDDPRGGYFESTLDLPGTFDCELTPADAFSCQLYQGDDDDSTAERYRAIRAIIAGWVSDAWLTFERVDSRPEERRRFVAQRIRSGALLTLVVTNDYRLVLRFEPPPR